MRASEGTTIEVARYRRLYPILARTTYLNSCSLGAMPLAARDGLLEYARLWEEFGTPAWSRWFNFLDQLRATFGRTIGAPPEEVAVSPCISTALTSVASSLDYGQRPRVVISDLDFPTVGHQWLARAPEGVEVRFAASPDRIGVPLERFEALIDERTALVATSHVYFTSGAIADLKSLARLAHERGALLLADAYQSVGSMPVDVRELDVDFLVCGTLKWLTGGPGIAFLWVRPELIPRFQPRATGWLATADPFAFAVQRLTPAPDAVRFQYGTPPVPTAYAARPGMDIVLEVGIGPIRERIVMLTRRLIDAARARGIGVQSPERDDERGGIVMLKVPHPQETVEELIRRGFIVDHRPGLVRVSPHYYNTEAEIDAFMTELEAVQAQLRFTDLDGSGQHR